MKEKLMLDGPEIFKKFQLKKVILYGSVLEERMGEMSDVDLLVDYLPPDKFFAFQCLMEEVLNIPVDVHTMDEDAAFTNRVLQQGEVIYEV
jgi:predicted nucleotidyltransferase